MTISKHKYTQLLRRSGSQKRKRTLSRAKYARVLPAFGKMGLSRPQELYLDQIAAIAVKEIAGWKCERCYTTEGLQHHHAVGKRRKKTIRHKVSNGFALCGGCHMKAEQDGIEFAQWAIKRRGQEWWDDLQAQSRELKVWREFTIVLAYLLTFIKPETIKRLNVKVPLDEKIEIETMGL